MTEQQAGWYVEQPGQPKPKKGKALGIIALVLGVIGLALSWIPFVNYAAFVPIFAGIVLGIIALVRAKGGRGPKVFSIIAIIVSTVALLIAVMWVFLIAAIVTEVNDHLGSGTITQENGDKPFYTGTEEDEENTKGVAEEESSATEEQQETTGEEKQETIEVVIAELNQECATKWFTFTVNSLTTASSYDNTTSAEGSFSARDGNILVIANITITNMTNTPQPFGTFDWFVHDDASSSYVWAMDPRSVKMMPEEFTLAAGETANYDVVVEIAGNLRNAHLTFVEQDNNGEALAEYKIPIY